MKWIGRADPLVLFLAAGLALYLVLDVLGLAGGDERLIEVDEAGLAAFAAGEGGPKLDAMNAQQRRGLVERYVREEALYREARALGLDRGDTAIRRRLVQSLRFSLQGDDAGEQAEPGEDQLRAFLASNRERYAESAKVSFSHVFFDVGRRGEAAALAAARETLPLVNGRDWLALGDRYPYQRSQVDVTREALSSELGEEAADRILAMKAGGDWRGPVKSSLGIHLVRIDRTTPGREPDFSAIRDALVAGWRDERRERDLQRTIDAIVEGYSVALSPELERQLK